MSKHKQRHSSNLKNESKQPLDGRFGLVYARVSSKRQELEGSGLQSQASRCVSSLQRDNIPHEKTFSDSYSGGGDFMQRPAMRELLSYIDSHPHKKFVVIFDDLKRFARDLEFHWKLRSTFQSRDVVLLCLNHNFDDSPEGKFVESVIAAAGELERNQNGRQVVQKQKARLSLGYNGFPAPLGYTKINDSIRGRIDIPNEKAQYIREALEGFSTMRFLTKSDVVRFLQEKNVISNKQAIAQALPTIDRLLRSKFYIGVIEYIQWEVTSILGKHEPIISIETYEKNQKRLAGKNVSPTRKDLRPEFELRGLVNCTSCKHTMTAANSKGKVGTLHPYYRCQYSKCSQKGVSIKSKDMHDNFYAILKKIEITEGVIDLVTAIYNDAWKEEQAKRAQEVKINTNSKIELEEKVSLLTDKILTSKSPTLTKAYEVELEKTTAKIESLEEYLADSLDHREIYKTTMAEVLGVFKSPYETWISYDVDRKQKFFKFFFEGSLEYSKNQGYKTPNYALPIRLFEEISTTNSVNVEVGGIEPPCKG
jgi:site-specific DNA recombinase